MSTINNHKIIYKKKRTFNHKISCRKKMINNHKITNSQNKKKEEGEKKIMLISLVLIHKLSKSSSSEKY